MKLALTTAAAIAAFAMPAVSQEATVWNFDPSHSQIVFTYNHLGFSTTTGMFSGFDGTINLDEAAPENSSVEVSFPVRSMITGWDDRFGHFMSDDFFGAADGSDEMVSFTSTSVEVTGDNTAKITGDLTLNGVTKEIVLDTVMNQMGDHPSAGKPWIGFNAETTLMRSDYELGMFGPAVSDEVEVEISVEATKAE